MKVLFPHYLSQVLKLNIIFKRLFGKKKNPELKRAWTVSNSEQEHLTVPLLPPEAKGSPRSNRAGRLLNVLEVWARSFTQGPILQRRRESPEWEGAGSGAQATSAGWPCVPGPERCPKSAESWLASVSIL